MDRYRSFADYDRSDGSSNESSNVVSCGLTKKEEAVAYSSKILL